MNGFKTCLCSLAMAVWTGWAVAAEFAVAPLGSDDAPGNAQAPFRTIQQAARVMLPGDLCRVQAGVYRESVRPARSGEEGKPIRFEALGEVTLNGAEPITGWTAVGNGVYRAACDGPVTQLFADGVMMTLARWPNAPLEPMEQTWAAAEKGSEMGLVVDSQLPALDLNGAIVHMLPGEHWVSWTRGIRDCNPDKHSFAFDGNWSSDYAHVVKSGSKYFLMNHRALLDAPGEWFYDDAEKALYLCPCNGADPARQRIEVKRRNLAFDLSALSNVQLKGFRVFGSTISLNDAAYCAVEQCHLRYASHFIECEGWAGRNDTGIIVGGHDNLVSGSSVVYSAGNGVTLTGENNVVTNCLVRNVDYAALDCAAVWMEGTGNAIRHSSLHDTGRSIIVHRTLRNGRIEYNELFNAGRLTTDLGITYCFGTDGAGTIIAYNWVHDNKAEKCGVGIYIDNNSSNFLIHHNVSFNNGNSGIRLNTPSHNNLVYHNTVLNNGDSLHYWGPDGVKDQAGCRVFNNIFINKVVTGDGIELKNNYLGREPGIVSPDQRDFTLKPDSGCVDAGIPIAAVNDGFKGKAPDQGAYELGAPAWKPGHDWGEAPEF